MTVKLKVYYNEEKENYGFWNTYVVTLEKTKKLKTFIRSVYMNGVELLLVISYLIYSLLLNFIVLFEMIFPKKKKKKNKFWRRKMLRLQHFHNKKLPCSCH